ncbi:hypothetical protein P692DRAFT_201272589 [Suillus brevipes Sb2]|nr:hypothetical protein P692DRAFT_201272589 [Suillus brevipes Sb2]
MSRSWSLYVVHGHSTYNTVSLQYQHCADVLRSVRNSSFGYSRSRTPYLPPSYHTDAFTAPSLILMFHLTLSHSTYLYVARSFVLSSSNQRQ